MGVHAVLVVDNRLRAVATLQLAQRLRFANPVWRASTVVV